MKPLIVGGNQPVSADSGSDLGFHSVLAGDLKMLDAQVLLDPIEEEFDPSTVLVEGCKIIIVNERYLATKNFILSPPRQLYKLAQRFSNA